VGRLLACGAKLWRQAAGEGSRSRYAGSNWNPQLPPGRLLKPAESLSLGVLRQKADRHAFNVSKASPLCLFLLYAAGRPDSLARTTPNQIGKGHRDFFEPQNKIGSVRDWSWKEKEEGSRSRPRIRLLLFLRSSSLRLPIAGKV
jgi:hypothetical protein